MKDQIEWHRRKRQITLHLNAEIRGDNRDELTVSLNCCLLPREGASAHDDHRNSDKPLHIDGSF